MPETAARSCLAVILAAGEGTRMQSALPKVMHRVAGRPMLGHVLAAARAGGADRQAVVVGPDAAEVAAFVAAEAPSASLHRQAVRRGTADAVRAAHDALATPADDILVLYGDTPLVSAETLARLRGALAEGAEIAVLGFRPPDPAGYGRLILRDGLVTAIREHRDASAEERAIALCNAGVMAFRGAGFLQRLDRIGNDNAKGEFYLTDAVALAVADGKPVVVVEAAADEVIGVDTRAKLAEAEAIWQAGARRRIMDGGATLVAPETVFLCHDTRIGRDVVVEPHVVFGLGVTVEDCATIRAFSHLEGAHVAGGAIVGPFARLRPGADIGENAHIGNFVEIKNATVAGGAKINHLTYIGDASIGAATNVGAGTITCNYDGFNKHRTTIGSNAFIGSNTSLVAPVVIGDGAYIGSGSVITQDVAPDSLAIGRARQVDKPGWASRLRALMLAGKAERR